jgi:multidrug efflux system membrane fusion protein
MKEKWEQAKRWFLGLARWQQILLGVVVLALLLFSGGAEPEPTPAPQMKLIVSPKESELHARAIVMYGQTQPVRDVALSVQTQGEVVSINAKEGNRLRKGDVILSVDARERPERLAQAKAELKQREIEYEAARKLQRRGFESDIRLAQSKAQLEQARAALKQTQLDAGFAELRAPFDGILEEVNREIGDFAGVGTFGLEGAAARIVDLDPLLVVAQLPEKDRGEVAIGDEAEAKLADGRVVRGYVSHLGHVANAQSRTFKVEVEVPNPNAAIPAGITAELIVKGRQQLAYGLPASVLGLDDTGRVGVKHLDADNRVLFEPVEIIEETPQHLWVSGLPERMRLITTGHAYVSAGQEIPADAIQMEAGDEQPH